jgi:hypothetical protein
VRDEIKSWIAAGNRSFYGLRQIFRSRAISNMMVKPVVVYGSETEKNGYMGEKNVKDIRTSGRARNMENKN